MCWDKTVCKTDKNNPALRESMFWYSKKMLQEDTQTTKLKQRIRVDKLG